MKTSTWINLIGITCIVLGAFGAMEHLLGAFMPVGLEDNQNTVFNTNPLLEWGGVLVKMFYLLAGILFLMKKRFSLNLMYFALIINIIYGIVRLPLLYNNSSPDSDLNTINILTGLTGPVFNSVLLFFVYRISTKYFKSPSELSSLEQNKPKFIWKASLLKAVTIAGFLCMALPLTIMVLWINSSVNASSQAEAVNNFNKFFPVFLQGRFSTSYLGLIFCTLAMVFGITGLRLAGKLPKTVNILVLTLSSLLFLMNLWSLM